MGSQHYDTPLVPPIVYVYHTTLILFRLWELCDSLIYQIAVMALQWPVELSNVYWASMHTHIWHTSNPINTLCIPQSLSPFKLGEIKLFAVSLRSWSGTVVLQWPVEPLYMYWASMHIYIWHTSNLINCLWIPKSPVCTSTSDTHPI